MAMTKTWIKYTVISLSVLLFSLVLTQLALTGYANAVLSFTFIVPVNSSVEFVCIALFITPAVWVGLSAAMSRHRGVYITLTVFVSLSLMSCIGLIVYEAYEFGTRLLYTTAYSGINGVMITKLVCWSVMTVVLMLLLGIAIASNCAQKHRRDGRHGFEYYKNQEFSAPGYSLPPDYASNPVKSRPLEPMRDYPRMAAAPPRFYDYTPSPRAYYPKYY